MKNTKKIENQRRSFGKVFRIFLLLLITLGATSHSAILAQTGVTQFAVIGDYGSGDNNQRDVANLVKSWNPQFIITLGDNNYPDGEATTIDHNIGRFYQEFIAPYYGGYGPGATSNRFFPSLGNHDWDNRTGIPASPYLDYFTLPNNERYYDFVWGSVHFFVLDSDSREPDGITSSSIQANWLRQKLLASTSRWKIVYFHHTPYCSRTSTTAMRWQFQEWGATAVLAGHAHLYERVMRNGFPYFTNGLGGDSTGTFLDPIEGSVVRFGSDYGAQLVTADENSITFQFITRRGVLIDSYTIGSSLPAPPLNLGSVGVSASQVNLAWTDNSFNENGFRVERCQNAGCTNFQEIGQTGINAASFSDGGRTPETTYAYRVRAFNNTGFSDYSNVVTVTTPTVGATLFEDDFNDNLPNPAKWNVGILSRSSSNFNPQIIVAEQDGQLLIAPLPMFSSNAYSGYVSAAQWSMIDSNVSVEVAEKALGNSATIFSFGIDRNNWYSFRAKGSSLYLENRINGITTGLVIPFDPIQHRGWRLRHDAANDSILFETSSDGIIWILRRAVARQLPLNAIRFEMIAGTGETIANPGAAKFDNFRLTGN